MGDTAAEIELEEYAWRRSPSPPPPADALRGPCAVDDVYNFTPDSARTRLPSHSRSSPDGQTCTGCPAESCGLTACSTLKTSSPPRAQVRDTREKRQDSAVSAGENANVSAELFDCSGARGKRSDRSISSP